MGALEAGPIAPSAASAVPHPLATDTISLKTASNAAKIKRHARFDCKSNRVVVTVVASQLIRMAASAGASSALRQVFVLTISSCKI
jgi:hypothetical protein